VVGCTIGSREEVPGERKPVIRVDDDDDDDEAIPALYKQKIQ
jgi:hypothetical protein